MGTGFNLVSEAIEDYCTAYSERLSPECQAIEKYTREHVPKSIMLVGPLVASFLGFLVKNLGVRRCLEIGTYTGYSALAMAENLPEDGRLVTLDHNAQTTELAREFWKKSRHGRKIQAIVGEALANLGQLEGPFDMVFLDATKQEYIAYAEKCLPLLAPKGCLVADNCLYDGMVLEKEPEEPGARGIISFNNWVKGRSDLCATLLPIRDGLYLIQKK